MKETFDAIIIGGSYSGLSAAMALGRATRNVLIIDGGRPCNRYTRLSHNFITHDGELPGAIIAKAKEELTHYATIHWQNDLVTGAKKISTGFEVHTESGSTFTSRKLILATGIIDVLPPITGFRDCWGISILHCPYCHGYEVRNLETGIMANGADAFHYAQLISNWTSRLTVFTNGPSTITRDKAELLAKYKIQIIEGKIAQLHNLNGYVHSISFDTGESFDLKAIYHRPVFEQHCKVAAQLGCELSETGLLKADAMQRTNVPGVFVCGDNSTPIRSLAWAVATGNMAGAALNSELTVERFT
jgi:thioredoxin reductase